MIVKTFEQFINENAHIKDEKMAEMLADMLRKDVGDDWDDYKGMKQIWLSYRPGSSTSVIDRDDLGERLLRDIPSYLIGHILGFKKNDRGSYEYVLDDEGQRIWDKKDRDYTRGAAEYYSSKKPGEYTGD